MNGSRVGPGTLDLIELQLGENLGLGIKDTLALGVDSAPNPAPRLGGRQREHPNCLREETQG